jgi:hypothetical protein
MQLVNENSDSADSSMDAGGETGDGGHTTINETNKFLTLMTSTEEGGASNAPTPFLCERYDIPARSKGSPRSKTKKWERFGLANTELGEHVVVDLTVQPTPERDMVLGADASSHWSILSSKTR